MKSVFSSASQTLAALLRTVLENEGITSTIGWQDDLPPPFPLPLRTAHVYVNDDDYDRAIAIAKEFQSPAPQNPWKWSCTCGEDVEEQFAACWRCGRKRPTK